jgi:hypothetical protein
MGNPETLFELLEQFNVVIPIIQRDYVQGRYVHGSEDNREDERTKKVIDDLLTDIRKAVEDYAVVDLNFIYGKEDKKKKFLPIDGQQRLTTLFLLHLYAFRDDDSKKELFKKFTYETRVSSRDFLAKLIEHQALFSSDESPSVAIRDEPWFHIKLGYDPTVISVLNVLDEIRKKFHDVPNLAERLLDTKNKPIKFNFISMDDMGMEDSLYIKLNARGKELTPFEEFKADLVGKVEKMEDLPFTKFEFELALDTVWSDYFWKLDRKTFDDLFCRFFALSFNRKCISAKQGNEEFEEEYTPTAVTEAYYTLNFIANTDSEGSKIAETIKKILKSKDVSLSDRILFNSISVFMRKSCGKIDNDALEKWYRIIKNLATNSNLSDKDSYNSARSSIDKLAEHYLDMTIFFAKNVKDIDIKGFSKEQVEEECVKAKLIIKSDKYREGIIAAEAHEYFSGQLRSALYLAGLEGLTLDDIDSQIEQKFTQFLKYWEKIALLFEDKKPKDGNLLRAALLAHGDYLKDEGPLRGGHRKTFYINNPSNETDSMKMLFSDKDKYKYVKPLLDSITSDKITYDEIAEKMREIVEDKLTLIPETDWKHWVMKYREKIFCKLSPSHMRILDFKNGCLLIPSINVSTCRELFTFALSLELEKRGIKINDQNNKTGGTSADYFVEIGEKYRIRHSSEGFFLYENEKRVGDSQDKPDAPDVSGMIELLKQKNII